MKPTFTMLRPDEARFLKQILINSENLNELFALGYIMYERKMTPNYRMKLKSEGAINLEYPEESDFPTDELDDLILNVIKQTYSKTVVKTSWIISTLDEEHIQFLKEKPNDKALLQIHPIIRANMDFPKIGLQNIQRYKKEIPIYTYNRQSSISNIAFTATFEISKLNGVFQSLDKLHFI